MPRKFFPSAAIAVVAGVLFRSLLTGQVLFWRDIHALFFVYREALARAVSEGAWPVWYEGHGFGQPLLALSDAQILYPTTWLSLILTPWTSYGIAAVLHLLFTGAGMYRLASRFGMARPAATLSACAWMASGPLLSMVNVQHHYAGAVWIPWVVLAVGRAWTARSGLSIVWAAAALAMQVFAGSGEMSIVTGGVLVAFAFERWWLQRDRATAVRTAAILAGVGGLALMLSAPQWMPTVEIARRSERWRFDEDFRTHWSLHPMTTPELALPLQLSALPLTDEHRAALFEAREAFLESIYLGLPICGLVLAALLGPRRPHRVVLAVISGAGLLVALGRYAPFYRLAVAVVPGLGVVRYPVKIVIVTAFGVALLAGMGLEAIGRLEGRRRRWFFGLFGGVSLVALGAAAVFKTMPELSPAAGRVAFAGLCALAACVLAWWRRAGSMTIVAALGVVDLLAAHVSINPTMPAGPLAMRPELLDRLEGQPRERFYVYDYQTAGTSERHLKRHMPFAARAIEGYSREAALSVALREYLVPATAIGWGVEYAFDPNAQRLYPGPMARLNERLREVENTPEWRRLLILGSVSHVVALHEDGMEGLELVGALSSVLTDPMRVYRVPHPLPRAVAVSGVRVADGNDALRTVDSEAFDPRREVLLPEGASIPPRPDFRADVRVTAKRADRKTLRAELSHDGYVVMTDAFDPGWRVRVDGQEAPLLRGNVAFRAVKLAAGRHEIELVYRPAGLRYGLRLASLGVVIAAVLVTRSRRPPAGSPSVGEAASTESTA